MKNGLFNLVKILALGATVGGPNPSVRPNETIYTLPGSAAFDVNTSVRTAYDKQQLENILDDANATEDQKQRLLNHSNITYNADNKTADVKLTTIKFGDRDDPDQSPERYGKSLDALGATRLYIISKPFSQVTLEDLTNAEAQEPGLYTIPLDSASTRNSISIEKYNLLWLGAQGYAKKRPNYVPLDNARNAENNLNYLPQGTTAGIVTEEDGKKEYIKLEITGQNDLGQEGDRGYFKNWSTSIRIENISKK